MEMILVMPAPGRARSLPADRRVIRIVKVCVGVVKNCHANRVELQTKKSKPPLVSLSFTSGHPLKTAKNLFLWTNPLNFNN